mmetsp:Transcript_15367/g.43613  ORF Transcript_15367/g.43613 Transcript_15367/m.43613 type:complete len:313 (+) Transcript_15367:87-1025(+)
MGITCSICAAREADTNDELVCDTGANAQTLQQLQEQLQAQLQQQLQQPLEELQRRQFQREREHEQQLQQQPEESQQQQAGQQPDQQHEQQEEQQRSAPLVQQIQQKSPEEQRNDPATQEGDHQPRPPPSAPERKSSFDTCASSLTACTPMSSDIEPSPAGQMPEVDHLTVVFEPRGHGCSEGAPAWQLLPSVGSWRQQPPSAWLEAAQRAAAAASVPALGDKVLPASRDKLFEASEAGKGAALIESALQPPDALEAPAKLGAAKPAARRVATAAWARMPSVGTWAISAYHPPLAGVVAELQEAATIAMKAEA